MPPPKRQKHLESQRQQLEFTLDERKYVVRADEVSGTLDRELRKVGALTFGAAMGMMGDEESIGLDALATLVYVARRQAGEPSSEAGTRGVSYAEIEDSITYGSLFVVGGMKDIDAGEAPAAATGGTSPT